MSYDLEEMLTGGQVVRCRRVDGGLIRVSKQVVEYFRDHGVTVHEFEQREWVAEEPTIAPMPMLKGIDEFIDFRYTTRSNGSRDEETPPRDVGGAPRESDSTAAGGRSGEEP